MLASSTLRWQLAITLVAAALPTLGADINDRCHATSPKHRVALVELFTSEGCSSCPPADNWLRKQASRLKTDQAIFISNHVPYWDYLGWKDRFANPVFEQRQRQLARINRTTVYTPQFFVNGKEARFRFWDKNVNERIGELAEQSAPVVLTIKKDGSQARFQWQNATDPQMHSYVALTSDSQKTQVTAGENNRATLKHAQVTRWWKGPFKISTPQGGFEVKIPYIADKGNGNIIFFLANKHNEIVQAVALPRDC